MNMAEPFHFNSVRDEPMSKHVSLRAGGRADRFFAPKDEKQLAMFLRTLSRADPILFVGLGSNLLVFGVVMFAVGATRNSRTGSGRV